MDKLSAMRAFAAVAEEGSFTGGGRRLGITTKLISKQVKQLETELQVQLFNRTTRRVSLTDVGTAYLMRCKPLLDQLDELEDVVLQKQSQLAGPIRLTAPTGYGATCLTDALIPFMSSHPEVTVDLRLSDTRLPLVEEGLDMAVRIGKLQESSLIARKLADMPLIVCASPNYLAEHGEPKVPEALSTHTCLIDENVQNPTVWQFKRDLRQHTARISGMFHANAPGAIARMAIGGVGIARCPAYTVRPALQDGRLKAILTDFETDIFGVYAVYPPNRHLTVRVRALIDHLARVLSHSIDQTRVQ